MTSIFYVHGAGASATSFTYLQSQLVSHTPHFLSYTATDTAESTIEELLRLIDDQRGPVILIGHSFGGVLARAAAIRSANVSHLVTICAPFGGLHLSVLISLFDDSPMFRELRPYSPLLNEVRDADLRMPHLAIVGSGGGLPIISKPNDGVLTVESQTAIPAHTYANIRLNHFEVLLSPVVAASINEFLAA